MDSNIESAYEPKKYEDSIYDIWLQSKAFTPTVDPKKESFVISMPPPNATGVLHLGHATMLALQDIMIRWQRMLGKSALWLPGTDHAGIATQSVVEKSLQAEGFSNPREQLGRDKLLSEIRTFVENSKDCIRNQVKKMGSSCDWTREKYTLDDDMNVAVNTLFESMFEDGVIYRGNRIVNWDPKMQTTVADDEIEHVEETTKFYYLKYGPVVIGTARPETKFLDKIIVVNPKDKRYKHLIGKEVPVDWIDGEIKAKVIGDECVDMELGTGAMTITPAHSLVDFELAQKYNLEMPQIIDFDGNILNTVSTEFGAMSIEEARPKIVEKLDKLGLVERIDENYQHKLAVNYRGKGVLEPQIKKQWFIDVNKKAIEWKGKKMSIKQVLQDVIKSKMIKIVPDRFEKTYFHWIDNLRDWCISRQIWWGHQIPVWYHDTCQEFDGQDKPAFVGQLKGKCLHCGGTDSFTQDTDTLDTWFSSSLWTFATLGWPNKTEELEYFHPTDVLETGYDILFFWVARMILASTYALRRDGVSEEKSIPFKNVYLHGLVRDRNGKKMSKSNPETCIDPIDMIEKYGADALRLSLVIGATPGNDLRLYEEKIAGYRNFVNKIWNASRFALMNVDLEKIDGDLKLEDVKSLADKWILTKLQKLIGDVDKDLAKYRFSDAGMGIYDFMWREYCDWYLEVSKGAVNPNVLLYVLKSVLTLLHPFVPFVTEQLWSFMNAKTLLVTSEWPVKKKEFTFTKAEKQFELGKEIINLIRSMRADAKVDPGKKIEAVIYGGDDTAQLEEITSVLMQMGRLSELSISNDGPDIGQAKVGLYQGVRVFLPLKGMIDMDKEKIRLEKQLIAESDLVTRLESKLNNPGFVDKAPAKVVDEERGKLTQAKANCQQLNEQIKALG